MLYNYFITAYRNFFRNKAYTLLSLAGLTLGVASVISIYTYLHLQLSYDKHQSNYSSIYRVLSDYNFGDQSAVFSTIPHPLGLALKNEVAGLEVVTNTHMLTAQVNIPTPLAVINKFNERGIAFAHQDIFEIIDFHWLAGGAYGALSDPGGVVLSATLAQKYFDINTSYDQAIGRTINLANKHDLIVKGVYADFPNTTDLPFAMVTNYDAQEGVNPYFGEGKAWGRLNGGTQCYFKLAPEADPASIEATIKEVVAKNNKIEGYSVKLQPMSDVHQSEYGNYSGTALSADIVKICIGIGALLLLVSCINFVNIATARAIKRAREVGIRKVLGGQRSALISQFVVEAFIIVAIAHVMGFLIADLFLSVGTELLSFTMSLKAVPWYSWVGFCGISVPTITTLAGLYPAFALSAYSPLKAMRSKITNIDKQGKVPFRKILVSLQYAVSVTLIMGTIVMVRQLDYLRSKDMGFSHDKISTLVFPEPDFKRQALLKSEIEKLPGVNKVSLNLGAPLANTNNTDQYFNPETSTDQYFTINDKIIDENYLEVFNIKLLAGRNLNASEPAENVLVSLKTIESMGIEDPHSALGKIVQAKWGGKFQIVGVTENFNVNNLQSELMPVLMRYDNNFYFEMAIALQNSDPKSIMAHYDQVKTIWEKVYPELILEQGFLSDRIVRQYRSVETSSKMIRFFALMALVICAIGLYGLTDFMANAKKKEIGVRKIVGATIPQIVGVFVKEIGVILSIAFIASAALTYLGLQDWLETYAYHISIGWEVVVLSLVVIIGISVATMGWRSLQAARMNMVEVLKDE